MSASPYPSTHIDQASIEIRGARTHNLRDIDVNIPRHKLVAITGVSGSGKSSLAFDTLYAEGRRRYLASLSIRSRQFVSRISRPDVDLIRGLPPTIAVEQRAGVTSRRSTLATVCELYDLLRVLYARAGVAHCTNCGAVVTRQSTTRIVQQVLALGEGRKLLVLAPVVRGQRGGHKDVLERIAREGLVRARVDGQIVDASDPPKLKASAAHDVDAVVDRIVLKPSIGGRLGESIDLALEWGDGQCVVSYEDAGAWHDRFFSSRFACARCRLSFPNLEPRSFSFHSAFGACPGCRGTGLSADLPHENAAGMLRECEVCHGARIGLFAANVRFGGKTLPDLVDLTASPALEFFEQISQEITEAAAGGEFDAATASIAAPILTRIGGRLEALQRLGLNYAALSRPALTLSAGEYQRARLAAALGARHSGVCYVLDEPTTGLHPRDTGRLLAALEELRDQGNSVVVVEHENAVIRHAEHVIDLGPGAGQEGGRVVAQGTVDDIRENPNSLTGRCLNPTRAEFDAAQGDWERAPAIEITGARLHNLQQVSARFPLQALTAVAGVSGSGKTSLVMGTLVPALRRKLAGKAAHDLGFETITGWEAVERIVVADRGRLGKSPRSTPITAAGAWQDIRRVFARTREARLRGYSPRRFSFNAPEGACPECRGLGRLIVRTHLLPEAESPCATCEGRRYNPQTLGIRLGGRNVSQILEMTFAEAAEVFEGFQRIARVLRCFVDVGLGYLRLGQSAATLSGGEAQRVRLAADLSQQGAVRAVFVLDEPSSGLHPADIERVVGVLRALVAQGHTVIVIEHEVEIIRRADWVIDLGPDAGPAGGTVVVAGPPAAIAKCPASHTGAALGRL